MNCVDKQRHVLLIAIHSNANDNEMRSVAGALRRRPMDFIDRQV
jgi:hypothetical protein